MNQQKFDFSFVIFSILIAIVGAIIGMQIITTLGITPNTSIIGALVAMLIARIPMQIFYRYRALENQNLIQTTISSATFGAANSLLIPIGLPFVLGRPDLIIPMLIGAGIALIIDALILYKVFDSKLFGANETWPPGVATAEALKAGDQGGKKAKYLGLGIAGGIAGAWAGIPMSAFGVAFIGNIWALSMFGIGLLIKGYSVPVFNINLDQYYIPHGMMIGAGIVALVQFIITITKDRKARVNSEAAATTEDEWVNTRTEKDVTKAFGFGYVAFIGGALIVALIGGLITELSLGQLVLFLVFAAFAALVTQIIVGVAAMHSGWFPAFAVTLISLIIGLLMGFPPIALAFLVGYTAATGPAFADLGYDFKSGTLIRNTKNMQMELYGRKMQLKSAMIGFGVAIVMVALFHNVFFSQDLVPPVNHVYAATIEGGITGSTGMYLLLWAIPGALVQLIGGPKRQMGILFATGLLITFPLAGWAVIAGITIRLIILKVRGPQAEATMYTTAAGFIAGDALFSFFNSLWRAR
ncbi:putative oligopeptide transporter (OPT) family protein [Evansella vedderi]|uniref:Oligopeptide transporter (OPT) family protein n=1 Tax=Evansella vedderi TaxID=38282 RepID=A0ABT9ZNN2_9BACI|nr:OPT/YSL family transporter [Evansella vedderi]MDQ0252799.1 putative oligopeptide transporter (OPT) family protein [Evansella vedderi]